MSHNTLAFITADSSLALVPVQDDGVAAGSHRTLADSFSTGMNFSWPCWSPDGHWLVASAAGRYESGEPRLELWRFATDESIHAERLFQHAAAGTAQIAPYVTHYAAWAPTGHTIALIAPSDGGAILHLIAAQYRVRPQTLMRGGPLYVSWAPRRRGLAIHQGTDLMLLEMDVRKKGKPHRLIREQPSFRAPVWTCNGRSLLYSAMRGEEEAMLWLWDRDTSERRALVELDPPSALVRAPDTDLIALTTTHANSGAGGHDLRILDLTGGTDAIVAHTVEQGPVAAAFWAPDASALFYVSPLAPEPDLELMRYDLQDGSRRRLARFRPSPEYATLLAMYDQYAQSHAVISSDGCWITFAGLAANNGGGGAVPSQGCYVVPTDGSAPPRRVVAGNLAFFPLPPPPPREDAQGEDLDAANTPADGSDGEPGGNKDS